MATGCADDAAMSACLGEAAATGAMRSATMSQLQCPLLRRRLLARLWLRRRELTGTGGADAAT